MPDQPVLVLLGLLLIGLAVTDMIATALRVDQRGGIVTRLLTGMLWRAFHGGGSRRHAGPPAATGITITLVVVSSWVLLSFAGWSLLFQSDATAVVDTSTGRPADAWSRLYFTSFTLSTLGLGDYAPSGASWQVATGVASGFGFGVATLVITYLTSVVSAVSAKRELARAIWALGEGPQDLVRRSWDGRTFTTIDQHLLSLLPRLHGVVEQLAANPLIAYFKSSDHHSADVPAVAMLHDTLVILDAVDGERRLPELVTHPFCAAIDAYLDVMPGASRDPAEMDTPSWPDVEELQEAGIPVRSVSDQARSEASLFRRRRLGAVMHHQGWAWRDFERVTGQAE